MITLATLAEATAQEVFEQSAKHLLNQNAKSELSSKDISCMYKHGNLKCAAGIFIADSEYKPEMENKTWQGLLEENIVPTKHLDLIVQLQLIHDCRDVKQWKEKLIELGENFNLNTDFIA
jgi:hypothetical protein